MSESAKSSRTSKVKAARKVDFTVDTEQLVTTEKVLTPTKILELAGLDPSGYFLTEIEGRHQVSFENRPDEPIHMHNEMVFISAKVGPTPVS